MLDDRDYMRYEWNYKSSSPGGGSQGYIVNKIIVFNIIIFILQLMTNRQPTPYSPSTFGGQGGITSYLWLSVPTLIEFWRFITYMFVHGSFMHLLFNMWALYLFGRLVESHIGTPGFIKLYIMSGILGALIWLMFNFDSKVPVIGASGAIFGVMAAVAILFPDIQLFLLFPPVVLRAKTLVICLAIIDIVMLSQMHTGIAHLAHLGGLLGGFIYIKFIMPESGSGGRMRHKSHPLGNILSGLASALKSFFRIRRPPHPPFTFHENDPPIPDDELISASVDPILDKIGKYGMKSLTPQEKKILEMAREKLKDRS